jgi:hypothetical protein
MLKGIFSITKFIIVTMSSVVHCSGKQVPSFNVFKLKFLSYNLKIDITIQKLNPTNVGPRFGGIGLASMQYLYSLILIHSLYSPIHISAPIHIRAY